MGGACYRTVWGVVGGVIEWKFDRGGLILVENFVQRF